jgi:hypothetical protein
MDSSISPAHNSYRLPQVDGHVHQALADFLQRRHQLQTPPVMLIRSSIFEVTTLW